MKPWTCSSSFINWGKICSCILNQFYGESFFIIWLLIIRRSHPWVTRPLTVLFLKAITNEILLIVTFLYVKWFMSWVILYQNSRVSVDCNTLNKLLILIPSLRYFLRTWRNRNFQRSFLKFHLNFINFLLFFEDLQIWNPLLPLFFIHKFLLTK